MPLPLIITVNYLFSWGMRSWLQCRADRSLLWSSRRGIKFYLFIFISVYVRVCVCMHTRAYVCWENSYHSMYKVARGHLLGAGSLLPFYEFQRWNSSLQACLANVLIHGAISPTPILLVFVSASVVGRSLGSVSNKNWPSFFIWLTGILQTQTRKW